ncbi:MAG: hypothetical protein R3C44_12055 [Chloroflexota bacterium]
MATATTPWRQPRSAGCRGARADRDAFTIGPYLFAQLPQISAAVEGFEDVTQ